MNKLKALLASAAFLVTASASAAPVAIDTMFVDNASASLSIGSLGPYTASTGINPPAEITMGSFQSSILNLSSGDFSFNIYSTGINGASAPSGTVDGSTITVDFSSLMGSLTYSGNTYDFGLWPFTTPLDSGTYVPVDSTFDLGWSNNISIDVSTFFGSTSVPATLDVNLQGYLTTVPVPAALWLFGSGLIALFGFSHRKKYSL